VPPFFAKRHRPSSNGPASGGPASPKTVRAASPAQTGNESMMARLGMIGRENNNKPPAPPNNSAEAPPGGAHSSLLSQALEKHPAMLRTSLVDHLAAAAASSGSRSGANSEHDDRGSDDAASSDRPASGSIMDGLMMAAANKTPEDQSRRLAVSPLPSSSSSAPVVPLPPLPPIASTSSNPLFPPGLEALYRQAGFPSAFLGLAAGAAAAGGPPGRGPGAAGPPSPRAPPSTQGGLQSHAGNPNRELEIALTCRTFPLT